VRRWRAGAVARAARGGLARRRVQTLVIGLVVLISTGASVLALGLVVDSSSPFDSAFAAQHGAHLVATVNSGRATAAQLRATARLPGVTASSGPFPEVTITPLLPGPPGSSGKFSGPPITLVGRATPGGPLDDLTLEQGRWPQRPGEIVLSRDYGIGLPLGAQFTASGRPGSLTVVGIASSIDQSADGWVLPSEIAALRAPGTPATAQMLYRFSSAGSAAALNADAAALARALPPGAVVGTQSYLAVKLQQDSGIAPIVPFVVAFGVIGLVLSVLIVVNVVGGAVAAGYRRIGVLKSIGFTPGQVVATYAGQVMLPALAGCLAGVVLGNALAVPLLAQTATVYRVGTLLVPGWVDVAVPAAMCCLAGLAAVAPALRAGRLSAVQAIATGRAPMQGRGYAAHRLLGRLRLPRPVTIGLAAPFARPARTAVTLAAVLLGAVTVTFAVGLAASLNHVAYGLSHARSEPVQVSLESGPGSGGAIKHIGPGAAPPPPSPAAQERAVEAALRAQPGTLRYVAEADLDLNVAGLPGQVPVTAFRGDASWTGYDLISGRWFTGPGQADVPTNFLTVTGKAIGDTITVTFDGKQIPVRIVGEVFDTNNRGIDVLTDWQTLAAAGNRSTRLIPSQYDVQLRPGFSPRAYAAALGAALGSDYGVSLNGNDSFFLTLLGLIGVLTLLLAAVAGLGVLNTVVLHTRERVHDLGIFKALGMTPRQTIAMVICWVAGTGLVAGVVAVPAGLAVHRYVLPVMAHAAATNLPASYLNVYGPAELALLALAGLVIAVAGAMLPASWAAGSRTASALRAE
jgi:putative ABC transport system permease protein